MPSDWFMVTQWSKRHCYNGCNNKQDPLGVKRKYYSVAINALHTGLQTTGERARNQVMTTHRNNLGLTSGGLTQQQAQHYSNQI